jgi:hypothetical protein
MWTLSSICLEIRLRTDVLDTTTIASSAGVSKKNDQRKRKMKSSFCWLSSHASAPTLLKTQGYNIRYKSTMRVVVLCYKELNTSVSNIMIKNTSKLIILLAKKGKGKRRKGKTRKTNRSSSSRERISGTTSSRASSCLALRGQRISNAPRPT